MSHPNASHRIRSCDSSVSCKSPASLSTRRTASPSGVTISALTTDGCVRPRHCAGRAIGRPAGRPSRRSPRRRRRRCATTSSPCLAWRSLRCSSPASIGRTSTCAWSGSMTTTPRTICCRGWWADAGRSSMRRHGRLSKQWRRFFRALACKPPRITRALKTRSARECRTRLPSARFRWCVRPMRSGWASTARTSTRSSTTRFRARWRRTIRRSDAPVGTDVAQRRRSCGTTETWRTREFLIDGARRDRPGHRAVALDLEEVARRKELEHRKLRRMIDYADSSACLRATILRYFGDPAVRERCDWCGNCQPGAIDPYEHELVRKILSGIARAGERYGRHRIVAMLTGHTDDLPPALARLSTTGLIRHETPDALHRWIDASIAAGLVVVSKDQDPNAESHGSGPGRHARASAESADPAALAIAPFFSVATLSRRPSALVASVSQWRVPRQPPSILRTGPRPHVESRRMRRLITILSSLFSPAERACSGCPQYP